MGMLKHILNMTNLVILASLFVVLAPSVSWAKKAERVNITVGQVNVSVNGATKAVSGDHRSRMTVKRSQRGNGCTKVPYVRVVTGSNARSKVQLILRKIGSKPKGLCNFTANFSVQPFSESELAAQCRPGETRRKVLRKAGLVSFWKDKPAYERYVIDGTRQKCEMVKHCKPMEPVDLHPGELDCTNVRECYPETYGHTEACNNACAGRLIPKKRHNKQNPNHRVTFAANIQCASSGIKPPKLSSPPDLRGWWYFKSSYASAQFNGHWKFNRRATRPLEATYSTSGIGMNGKPMVQNGSGTARIKTGTHFTWTVSSMKNKRRTRISMKCSGKLNAAAKPVSISGRCTPPRNARRSEEHTSNSSHTDISRMPSSA